MSKKKVKEEIKVKERIGKKLKVGIASRENYPVTITYEGDTFILSPGKRITKKEFYLEKLNVDPKEVSIIK